MATVLQHLLRVIGHFPVPGVRRAVWRLHGVLRNQIADNFEIHFEGLRYRGKLDDLIDINIFFFGSYAAAELDFLDYAARIKRTRGMTVTYYDVGANVGQHALFMSRRTTQVVAFEPSQFARERFEMNVTLNGLKNIQLFPVALGDGDGEGLLGSGFVGNSGSRSLTWTLDNSKMERTAIRRGDDLICEQNLPRMDILKLDVEGYEKRVLLGLRQTLLRDRPIVLMELIGSAEKGGFRDAAELHEAFYPEHEFFALRGRKRAKLTPFDWNCATVVCLPKEHVESFVDRIST